MAWMDTAGAAAIAAVVTQIANVVNTRLTQRTAQQSALIAAQATLEAKRTTDATTHDSELAKQQKEYNDNLRADNERLNNRLNDFQNQIDKLRAELMTAQQSIAENYKLVKTQEAQIQNMREREAITQLDHQDQVTLLHDKYVDSSRKLAESQAREQNLNLRLKNCKCVSNVVLPQVAESSARPSRIDINSETVHINIDGTNDIIGGT